MKSEEKIQQEIVLFFRNNYCLQHHKPKYKIFSIPNVGVAGARHQMTMVSTGLLAGAADLIVLLDGVCVFFEVKDEKGRQQDKQKDFENDVKALGFNYHLVRSLEEFQQIIFGQYIS